MKNIILITLKETKTYYLSPMAYIVGAMFLGLTWLFFNTSIVPGDINPITEANVRGYLDPTTLLFIIFSPLITMRLFSEEEKLGTLELLFTSPVKDIEIVIGKYLASAIILTSTLMCTFFYVLLIYLFSSPDLGPLLSAYLGIILYGIATLGVGLFASSLTGNQIVSAVVGTVLLLLLSFIDSLGAMLEGLPSTVFNEMALNYHFDDFTKGVIDIGNIIYYISIAILFLFFTTLNLQIRRWK